MSDVKIGFLLWPQTDSWPAIRDAAVRAEGAGAASLWTWDHLNSIVGPWEGPILEGWSILSGWAQVTSRATLGLMVAANTFRNPGLTAKLATTLDHLSGGRAVLGLGGAWFEREHEAFGIDFGAGFGERLDRLDESAMLLRRLLDGELVTHDGPVYPMKDALVAPRPVQARLPIMIGGSGPKKTLRTLAKYGDQWNAMGSPREARRARRDPARALRGGGPGPVGDRAHDARSTSSSATRREAALHAYTGRSRRYGEELDETWNLLLRHPGGDRGGPPAPRGPRVPAHLHRHARRPTTSRRSTGSARSSSTSTGDRGRMTGTVVALAGGVGGAKLADGLQAHLGRPARGHRQHRRRLPAPRAAGDARPRHGALQPRRDRAGRAGAGGSRATPTRRWPSWAPTARRRGSAWATGTSRCTSPGRPAWRQAAA